jgi:hypothetical protein
VLGVFGVLVILEKYFIYNDYLIEGTITIPIILGLAITRVMNYTGTRVFNYDGVKDRVIKNPCIPVYLNTRVFKYPCILIPVYFILHVLVLNLS